MADAIPQIAEDRKMGLTSATLMLAGNMMGSGVFMLPANLAVIGSITLIGWLLSTMGAIMLALDFSKLANIDPPAAGLPLLVKARKPLLMTGFLRHISKTNEACIPTAGLLVIAILMSLMALAAISPDASLQFDKLFSTAVILTLLPYIYTCKAIKITGYGVCDRRQYLIYVVAGFICAIFCIGALVSSNPAQTRWSLIFMVCTMPLYCLAFSRLKHIKEGYRPDTHSPGWGWIKWMTVITSISVLFITFPLSI